MKKLYLISALTLVSLFLSLSFVSAYRYIPNPFYNDINDYYGNTGNNYNSNQNYYSTNYNSGMYYQKYSRMLYYQTPLINDCPRYQQHHYFEKPRSLYIQTDDMIVKIN
jgi:hypothetical protein